MDQPALIDLLQRILRRWWLVATCMLAGGLLAFGFTRLQPPVYEASSIFSVSLDANQYKLDQGEQKLTDAKKQALLSAAQDVFFSEAVLDATIRAARQQGISLGREQLEDDLNVQRIESRWLILARARGPQTAAELANLWSQAAWEALQEASRHAVSMRSLELVISTLNACFDGRPLPEANACAGTHFSAASELEGYIAATQSQVELERQASQGVDANLEIEWTKSARPPKEPVRYQSGILIISGMLIGLLVSSLGMAFIPAGSRKHARA
jgi:hypothetical protein